MLAADAPSPEHAARTYDRAVLLVLVGPQLGSVFSLQSPETSLGRDPDADVRLDDDRVSELHAKLTLARGRVLIEDCGSRSGTFVNGTRVSARTPLADGDRLRVGDSIVLQLCLMDEFEERALCTLSELTLLDPLTRVYNRRYFDRRLDSELSFARRHAMRLAVLVIDVDHFKTVNDAFGHHVGDAALRVVARSIERLLRPEDVLARLGGDEFVVCARSVSLRNAEILGQRLCRRVEALCVKREDAEVELTVSVGVALLEPDAVGASVKALMTSADRALYRAKSQGRNQVVAWTVPEAHTDSDPIPPPHRTMLPPR